MKRSFSEIGKEIHEEKIDQNVNANSSKRVCFNNNHRNKIHKNLCDTPIDSVGTTKLMLAVSSGQLDHIKYYIQKQNASVNIQNHHGDSALSLTIKSPSTSIFTKVAIIQYLYDHGANLQIQTIDGHTPLHLSILFSLPIISNLLIQNGAFLEIQNDEGLTPLMLALKQNDIETATLLISWGADITRIQNVEDSNKLLLLESKNLKDQCLTKKEPENNNYNNNNNNNNKREQLQQQPQQPAKRRHCGKVIIVENRRTERKLVDSGGNDSTANSLWWM